MPIPVVIPATPLPITDEITDRAELFLTELVQMMKNGTSGGTMALQTPAILVPNGPNPTSTTPIIIDTPEKQIMFRQMALALVTTMGVLIRTADTGGVVIGAGVYYSANNVVHAGDCTNPVKTAIFGVAIEAITAGQKGRIASFGPLPGVLSGATAGTPYFLGTSGTPVLSGAVPSGSRLVQLGSAKNATDLEIHIQDLGAQP